MMATLLGLMFFIGFCIFNGYLARRYDKNYYLWAYVSVLNPLLVLLILIIKIVWDRK